jgi:hypothetical protein
MPVRHAGKQLSEGGSQGARQPDNGEDPEVAAAPLEVDEIATVRSGDSGRVTGSLARAGVSVI